jgi:hypothetical protein
MLESGLVTERQFNEDMKRLDDPELILPTPILWSAWGRKPV